MAALPHWPPEDQDAFAEWCIEQRTDGETWMNLAKLLKIGRQTLYDYLEKYPYIRTKIDAAVEIDQVEALRQTGMYMAIKKRDRQLLQFMLKAKAKMFDSPLPATDEKPLQETITQEQARQILEELRAKSK